MLLLEKLSVRLVEVEVEEVEHLLLLVDVEVRLGRVLEPVVLGLA